MSSYCWVSKSRQAGDNNFSLEKIKDKRLVIKIFKKKLSFFQHKIIIYYGNVLSRKKKIGRQNHVLMQGKMLHCKTIVNIITYHHVV
jgi:hypothetical protein